MNPLHFLLSSLLTIGLLTADSIAETLKPNIILIFVDDMGYGDLGCYGNETIKTPNIDRLAAEGQRWTSFYASGSTCVPSRTGLMSGRHPNLLGGEKLNASPQSLMPAILKREGYATAILGKWHLAGYPEDFTKSPMHPLECGFDYHFGTPGSNDVPAPIGKRQTREVFDNCGKFTFQVPLIRGREVVEFPTNQELFTRRYTNEAVKWIQSKKDERFFLYLAHNMPHAPVFASPEFQGTSAGDRYGDVIEEIDWSVGRVMAAIKEAGIEKETLIVFTSDNGPWSMFGPHGGTAAPLRGEKGTSWEGGFRVPGIFRWLGTIKPEAVDGMAANLDLYATFTALTGGGEPQQKPGYISTDLSGVLLRGEASPRQQWLFGSSAFRSGAYKIHLATKNRSSDPDTRKREPMTKHDPPLLFDLDADISEKNEIGKANPEVVARLLEEMKAFRNPKETGIVSVSREIYVKNTLPGKAPWVWTYSGPKGYREEIHTIWSHEDQERGYGDSPADPRRRVSLDEGKTWSPLEPLPPLMTFLDKVSVLDWKFCGIHDPASDRLVALSIHHVRDMRQGPPRRIYNHGLIRTSADGGKTFGPAQLLKYQEGADLTPETLLDPSYLENNTGYPGQSIFRHSNGSLIIPVTNANIPPEVEDEPVGVSVWPAKGGIGSLCFVGRWNAERSEYEWKGGKPVWLPREDAFNGLLEADVAELKDGRVLIVWRVTKNGKEKPAYKYFAVSDDGGLTFSDPEVFRYSDGSHFFSTSTFHRLFRSGKTGKLYWIGNILAENPTNPGHPRYPLIIAEVDEETLGVKKETVTQIDTRRPGEGKMMQLSNFWLTENQDNFDLEIYLTRLFENPEDLFGANAYRYTLRFR